MGVDFHGLSFIAYAAGKQPLGETATIGRQSVHLGDGAIRNILGVSGDESYGPYCELLLTKQLGATSVESYDNSDYENASFVHDFNQPLEPTTSYDTVVDLGSLEHIFNVPLALQNIARLCRTGGQIVHALPANNFNGHGFWQFSPELFFSLYSAANGFSDTEVFIAELNDERFWFKAHFPEGGTRVEFTSPARSYILVRTRKIRPVADFRVQQSDYLYTWENGLPVSRGTEPSAMRRFVFRVGRLPVVWRAFKRYYDAQNSHISARSHRLTPANRHFTRMPVAELVNAAR